MDSILIADARGKLQTMTLSHKKKSKVEKALARLRNSKFMIKSHIL